MCIRDRFSDYSYGFRAGRSCHDAIRQALEYLNDGYEWVVDLSLIHILRPLIIIVHVGKKSTDQNNDPYGTDPQGMCRRVVIKFVADGIDKI